MLRADGTLTTFSGKTGRWEGNFTKFTIYESVDGGPPLDCTRVAQQ